MASPALPVISPFQTTEADEKYKEYYEKGNILRVLTNLLFILVRNRLSKTIQIKGTTQAT